MIKLLPIFTILMIVEVSRHFYIVTVKKKSPNKALSLTGRIVIALILLYFDEVVWWISGPTYLFVGWWIHDYIYNIYYLIWKPENIKPRTLYSLNKTGPVDKFLFEYSPAIFFLKSIMVVTFVPLYFIYPNIYSGG